MDFNQFDARKAASEGAWLHLCHPSDADRLLYTGDSKPCRVRVIGRESAKGQEIVTRMNRNRATDGGKIKDAEDAQRELIETARQLITGFENIDRGDRPATVEDVDWFLGLQLANGQPGEVSFCEQVINFAFKRKNFVGNGPAF